MRPTPPRSALVRELCCLALACLAARPCVGALPDGFNHSEYDWQVIEAPHFRILYPRGMERTAELAATEAERAYPWVTEATGAKPSGRTDIILTDHEPAGTYAGRAYPFSHRIWLQSTSVFGPRGDLERTLGDIVAHELAHVCTFEAGRKGGGGVVREAATMLLMPFWFIEGLAETVSKAHPSTAGTGIVRAALLEGGLPELAQIAVADYDDSPTMTFTYRIGQGMVETIREEWGPEAIARILREHARLPVFDHALRKVIGLSEEELFDHWRRRARERYEALTAERDDVRSYARAVHVPAQWVVSAAWAPDDRHLAALAYRDVEEPIAELLVGRPDGTGFHVVCNEVDPLRSARLGWSPDGRYLAYVGRRSSSAGRITNQLRLYDCTDGRSRTVPLEGQTMDVAWSPDGGRIACVLLRESGWRRDLVTVRPDGSDLRALTGGPGMPASAYAPSWSPDGRRIVCEVYEGRSRPNLAIIQADGSSFDRLTADEDANRMPVWSADGRSIAFVCDRDVFPDLWTVDVETRTFRKHTNERLASITYPGWRPQAGGITVTLTRARSAGLWTVPLSHVVATLTATEKAAPSPPARPSGWLVGGYPGEGREAWPRVAADASWERHAYDDGQPFRLDYSDADLLSLGGMPLRASDPLNQHAVQVEPGYHLASGRPTLDALYENSEGPVTVRTRAFSHGRTEGGVGGRLLRPSGTGADLRAEYVRSVGGSALRGERLELGAHTETASLAPVEGAGPPAYAAAGALSFAEARWSRWRTVPARGSSAASITVRSHIPGLSTYPLQELSASLSWTHSASAGRRRLALDLDAGWARGVDWDGRLVSGAYLAPKVSYTFRLGDDLLPGLWPYLFVDRLEGRVSWGAVCTLGSPLDDARGHVIRCEIENRGYLHKLPYRLVVGVDLDTRLNSPGLSPYAQFGIFIPAF